MSATVRAIIEWCGTTDPAHVLAAQLEGMLAQQVIDSMDEVERLGKWAVIRDADNAVLELAGDRDGWWQTGQEDLMAYDCVTFPATVIFPGVTE